MSNKTVKAEQAIVAKRIVKEYVLSLRGHDNCHWHPELWDRLMRLFDIPYPVDRKLPPRLDFRSRCLRYEEEIYENKRDYNF